MPKREQGRDGLSGLFGDGVGCLLEEEGLREIVGEMMVE